MHPPPSQLTRQAWSGRTKGGIGLFRVCAFLLPLVGRPGAWLGSFLIGGGFLLAGGRGQFGMVEYWRRLRPGISRPLLGIRCWRHFASFGRILCDRLLVYVRPQEYALSCSDGIVQLRQALTQRQGCILLSAHLGNWELTGYWLPRFLDQQHPIYLVMVRDDIPHLQRYTDERMRGSQITVIDPRDGLSASLAIVKALEEGHPVCMLGDRVFGDQACRETRFLGGMARFPIGPFQAAAITGVPIFTCFMVKEHSAAYRLQVDAPWRVRQEPRGVRREQALSEAVGEWARRLEALVRRHPFQWHNFFPFWHDGDRQFPRRRRPVPSAHHP